MFPIISFDRSFRPRRLGFALIASSALTLPLALASLAVPAAAQTASPPALEQLDSFTDGPQLGNVTAHSIRIWARTRQPGKFRVLYSTSPDLAGAAQQQGLEAGDSGRDRGPPDAWSRSEAAEGREASGRCGQQQR